MVKRKSVSKYEVANKWLRLLSRKISILQYLKRMGAARIIIYGASDFALRLLEQCESEKNVVEVVGITDKRICSKGAYYKDIPLLPIDDIYDLIINGAYVIITAIGFQDEIIEELQMRGITNYILLKDLIDDASC